MEITIYDFLKKHTKGETIYTLTCRDLGDGGVKVELVPTHRFDITPLCAVLKDNETVLL